MEIDYQIPKSINNEGNRGRWGNREWKHRRDRYDRGLIEFEWRCRFAKPKPTTTQYECGALKDDETHDTFDACLLANCSTTT